MKRFWLEERKKRKHYHLGNYFDFKEVKSVISRFKKLLTNWKENVKGV
jgi:hypothetical protein